MTFHQCFCQGLLSLLGCGRLILKHPQTKPFQGALQRLGLIRFIDKPVQLLAFERSTLKCKSNLVKNSKNLQKKIFYMRHSINFEPFFQASFSKLNYIMCSDIILITNHQTFLKNIISFDCSTWQNNQMKANLCQIIEFL